jgi:excinuclease ABC subunit A
MITNIQIRGARTHNLKNIDLTLPRDRLIVITGLSGSGKSSLAFDTLYAEGQRRYVESLSAYARQFLSMMESPMSIILKGCRQQFLLNKNQHHIIHVLLSGQ